MKHPILVLSACTVILIACLLVTGCTSVSPGSTTTLPTTTVVTPGQSSCGFTTCHGLDLACGTNAPRVVPMSTGSVTSAGNMPGAHPGSDGSCTLVTSPQFAPCRSCVEQCQMSSGSAPVQAFDCEAKC